MNYIWSFFYPNVNKQLELGDKHKKFMDEIQKGIKLNPIPKVTEKELFLRSIRIGVNLKHIKTKSKSCLFNDIKAGVTLRHINPKNKPWTRPRNKKTGLSLRKMSDCLKVGYIMPNHALFVAKSFMVNKY